jgi:DNA-binding transcriptional MerR regulator
MMPVIGKLGVRAGVKVPTIRCYRRVCLLPEAEHSAGNQRLHDRKALERLAFIRNARNVGFTLQAIRELLSLPDRRWQSCTALMPSPARNWQKSKAVLHAWSFRARAGGSQITLTKLGDSQMPVTLDEVGKLQALAVPCLDRIKCNQALTVNNHQYGNTDRIPRVPDKAGEVFFQPK